MKRISLIMLLSALLGVSCEKETTEKKCFASECSEEAVIKDLTGLDGCSVVFELKDGTRLIPERRVYIQAPTPEDDPIYYFEPKAGDSVRVSYIESFAITSCMAGKVVFFTCITACDRTEY
ncbi:MAG: hypothetical protein AABY93_04930 [Bacteroidota bacterium]